MDTGPACLDSMVAALSLTVVYVVVAHTKVRADSIRPAFPVAGISLG